MAIRLVAVDVDGTLVTADQRVLPRVQAAAQRALEHGIQLVLCTGRAPGECWYILDALPQIRYAVTQTGAIAQDLKTGETLYHCPLSLSISSPAALCITPKSRWRALSAIIPPTSGGCLSGRMNLSTIWTPWSPVGVNP